jgi:hypothetical protein
MGITKQGKYTVHLIGTRAQLRYFDDLTKAKKAVERFVRKEPGNSGKVYTEGEPGVEWFDGRRWIVD